VKPRFGTVQVVQPRSDNWQLSDDGGLDLFVKVIGELQQCSVFTWSTSYPLLHYGSMLWAEGQRQALFHMGLVAAQVKRVQGVKQEHLLRTRHSNHSQYLEHMWPETISVRFDKRYSSGMSFLMCSVVGEWQSPSDKTRSNDVYRMKEEEKWQASFQRRAGHDPDMTRLRNGQPVESRHEVNKDFSLEQSGPLLREKPLYRLCEALEQNPEMVKVSKIYRHSLAELRPYLLYAHRSCMHPLSITEDGEALQILCKRTVNGTEDGIIMSVEFGSVEVQVSRWGTLLREFRAACGLDSSLTSWVPGFPFDVCVTNDASSDSGDHFEKIMLDVAGNISVHIRDCDYDFWPANAEHGRALAAEQLQRAMRYVDVLNQQISHAQNNITTRLRRELSAKRVDPYFLERIISESVGLGVSGTIVAEANAELQRLRSEHPHQQYEDYHCRREAVLHMGTRVFKWEGHSQPCQGLNEFCRLLVGADATWTGKIHRHGPAQPHGGCINSVRSVLLQRDAKF